MTTKFTHLIPPGTPVRVYWNLPSKVWSVQVRTRIRSVRGTTHVWRVAGHANVLTLSDCRFKVYEAGRQRVISTGVKNVHAYVLGTFQHTGLPEGGLWDVPTVSLSYNPVRLPHFYVRGTDQRVESATTLYLNNAGGIASLLARTA